jgi:hypothetical protein
MTLQLGVDGGYFVAKNLAITAGLGCKFQYLKRDYYSYYENYSNNSLAVDLGLRYYFVKQLFAGIGMMLATSKTYYNFLGVYGGIEVGYDTYISNKVFLEPSINFIKGFSYDDKSFTFGLGFGIGVKL